MSLKTCDSTSSTRWRCSYKNAVDPELLVAPVNSRLLFQKQSSAHDALLNVAVPFVGLEDHMALVNIDNEVLGEM